MNDVYLSLADGFDRLAAGYRALADNEGSEVKASPASQPEEREVDVEEVRAVLGEKSAAGKTAQVRALLMKYDAGRLSGVKPEDYAALLAEAEVL